jgi:nucleoside-diphosphate-sugar epimerase
MSHIIEEDILFIVHDFKASLTKLRKKRILVTGATGHLGHYFLKLFLVSNELFKLQMSLTSTSQSHLDNSFDEYKEVFEHKIGDLTDSNFINNFSNFDYIIHLAGYAQPTKFVGDNSSTIILNTFTVSRLLDRLSNNGTFLFISSSEIYSINNLIEIENNSTKIIDVEHHRAAYIFSKLLGEIICYKSNKNVRVARLSMTYGPGIKKDDSRAVSDFLRQAITKGVVHLKDSGHAVREYLYVADGVRALLRILLDGESKSYNIGAGLSGKTTIKEMAKIISDLLSTELLIPDSNIAYLSASQSVSLDVSKYESEFEKISKQQIVGGLKRTIDWALEEKVFDE